MSRGRGRVDQTQDASRESTLPPLHEVLGDLLVQPTARRQASRQGSSDSARSVGNDRSTHDRGPRLAPIARPRSSRPSGRHGSSSTAEASSSTPRLPSGRQPNNPRSPDPTSSTAHSYDLFNYTPNQGLVHARSSTQDDLDEDSKAKSRTSTPDESLRKYACGECGKRFAKPSTLRNHTLTHTGEKPFACVHPGCGKRFSMASNMQRHMRTHTSASAFQMVPFVDRRTPRLSPTPPSSARTSPDA